MNKILFVGGWAHAAGCADNFCDQLSAATGLACERLGVADLISGCAPPIPRSAYGRGILAFLDRHKDVKWIGMGWSMGALCLFEACLERPSAFEALVGCGATASFCSRPGHPAGIPAERVQAMLATLGKKPSLVLKAFFRDAYSPGLLPDARLRSLMTGAQPVAPEVLGHGLSYLIDTDLRRSCEDISAPVLLCHGKQDRIVPPEAARFCAGHIPHCLLHEFADKGHYLFDSPLCIEPIRAFLSRKGLG